MVFDFEKVLNRNDLKIICFQFKAKCKGDTVDP